MTSSFSPFVLDFPEQEASKSPTMPIKRQICLFFTVWNVFSLFLKGFSNI